MCYRLVAEVAQVPMLMTMDRFVTTTMMTAATTTTTMRMATCCAALLDCRRLASSKRQQSTFRSSTFTHAHARTPARPRRSDQTTEGQGARRRCSKKLEESASLRSDPKRTYVGGPYYTREQTQIPVPKPPGGVGRKGFRIRGSKRHDGRPRHVTFASIQHLLSVCL